jgi:16S rRNA processing protein RimM
MMHDEWNWTVGEVVAPFGRAGEMKVRLETDFPDRFARLKQVCLRPAKGEPRLFAVQKARLHKGQILLKVEGVESIDDAEQWRGARVQIRRDEAVPLPENSFYAADLVGMEVVTREGRVLGTLDKIWPYPAQDLFQVGEVLIPAVKEFILDVDVQSRRITVAPPEGLLPGEAVEIVE